MKIKTEIKEARFEIVRRWEASGLSQRKFSLQENISYQNLNNWIKSFRKHKDELNQGNFIKIESLANKTKQENIFSEITFANGNSIRFFNSVAIAQLKKLVS